VPSTGGDTGGSIKVELLGSSDPTDTGPNTVLLDRGLVDDTGFTVFPRFHAHDVHGVVGDTGTPTEPAVAVLENIRATLTPGDAGRAGRLFVVVK
jgi:hypothetical protein